MTIRETTQTADVHQMGKYPWSKFRGRNIDQPPYLEPCNVRKTRHATAAVRPSDFTHGAMLHAPREARTSKSHGCNSEEHCQAIMWPDLCLQNNIAGPTWIARPKTSTTLHPHWFLSELWHHKSVWFSLGLPLNPPTHFFLEKQKTSYPRGMHPSQPDARSESKLPELH